MKARGTVELSIQERTEKTRLVAQDYPVDQVPRVGEKVSFQGRNFVVMEVRHLLLKRGKKAVHGVLLIVEDFDALSW